MARSQQFSEKWAWAIEMALSVTICRWAGGNVSLNWQMGMTVWAVIRLK
jgi:hypothetical protein